MNTTGSVVTATATTLTPTLNTNLNISPLNLNFQLDIQRAREAARIAIEKAKRAKKANERLNEKRIEGINKGFFFPKPLRFDEHGRAIDEEGNVVDIKPTPHISLKINKTEESVLKNKKVESVENEEHQEQETFQWIDPRINLKKKRKHAFNFIRPGSLIEQANNTNANTSIETFQCDYDFKKITSQRNNSGVKGSDKTNINEQTGIQINITSTSETPKVAKCWEEDERYDVMEPWDSVLFTKNTSKGATYIKEKKNVIRENLKMRKSIETDANLSRSVPYENGTINLKEFYMQLNDKLCEENTFILENNELIINDELYKLHIKKITKYIEHPVPVHVTKKKEAEPTYMYLTPTERKKLRKRKRQEKEKEKQDKIKIGLLPPPPPKLKLSNLIKVLGSTASAFPSKIEMEVREQIKEREMRHYEQNQKRKLNPEEKAKKKINKWKCDPNEENEVAVVAIRNLSSKKNVFKLDINAQQLHLTGVCFISGICNFVVVEGKHVSVERYKRLIFRRIKWGNEDDEDLSDAESGDENKGEYNNTNIDGYGNCTEYGTWSNNMTKTRNCELIWNGCVKKRNFHKWKILNVKKESEIIDYMLEHNALHYYHAVRKYKDVQEGI